MSGSVRMVIVAVLVGALAFALQMIIKAIIWEKFRQHKNKKDCKCNEK